MPPRFFRRSRRAWARTSARRSSGRAERKSAGISEFEVAEVASASWAFERAGAATKLDWVSVESDVEADGLLLNRRRLCFLVGVVLFLARDLIL